MRHVLSGLAGLLLAPVVWVLVAYGSHQYRGAYMRYYDSVTAAPWMLLVILAGVLLGVLATLRLSPVGPLLMGLFYLSVQVVAVLAPNVVHRLMPAPWLSDPIYLGTFGFVGGMLVVSAFSVKRWRRWPESSNAAPGGSPFPGTPAVSGYPGDASPFGSPTQPSTGSGSPVTPGQPAGTSTGAAQASDAQPNEDPTVALNPGGGAPQSAAPDSQQSPPASPHQAPGAQQNPPFGGSYPSSPPAPPGFSGPASN